VVSLSPRSRRVVLTGHLASREAPTGAERSLALLAAGLARRGHRVTVLAPGPWCLSGELEEAGVQVRVVPTRPCWLTYWGSRPLPVVLWKGVRCAAAMRAVTRLAAALAELQPDVVVVNCLPHLAAAAAARRLGRPWLWYLREILPPGWRRRYFARRLVASGAVLVGVSEAVRAWVVGEQPSALVDVVYNGVPIPAEVPEAPAPRSAACGPWWPGRAPAGSRGRCSAGAGSFWGSAAPSSPRSRRWFRCSPPATWCASPR